MIELAENAMITVLYKTLLDDRYKLTFAFSDDGIENLLS